ncbi:MAG: hypothetical protein Q8N55_04085 [bacterium]|nr:hypothetical protein [bacterium]
MIFNYKKYGPGTLRPVIPIVLETNKRRLPYESLIDSGADICIFPAELAGILGIKIMQGKKKHVSGITGKVEDYYLHKIALEVGGWPYEAEVGFLPKIATLGYGVLGQKGFFDIFQIKFDYCKGIIEVKPK